jgi:hypothetical protein
MRELIRHILKENRLQQELKQVIKDGNIFDAADLVGGISPLKKIFKDDPEMSSLFEKLTGRIIFDYYVNKEHIEFPLDYEIIGRKSNNHKTNHWPEINVLYDENKLTPEENDTFKSMIKNLADDAQHSGFKSKFDDGRIFNANYLTVVELNGENIDSIWGGHYPWIYEVEEIYDKLYGRTESLNESDNRETDKKLKLVKEMIYSLFDEVEFIEVDTNYEGKPLIKVYHDVEDTAANYDNWFTHRIIDEIKEMTGDGVVLAPWWALGWDWKYKNPDIFIGVEKIDYDDEGNVINESDESKQERKFNKLIQNVEDYLNSNEYPSVKKFTVYYEDTHDDVIVNIFFNPVESVKLGGGINSVIKRVGKQVMEDLEVFPMDFKYYIHFDRDINESTEKQPKYLNIIKDLVEPFEDEDCVCDIRVLYDKEDDMYLIDLNMGTEELNEKFFAVIGMTHYVKTLRVKIKETIKDYLPIDNFYVGSYASSNCKWKPLNESSIKEKSLEKLIEKDGLYNFIEMSGLDFNQVRSLLKNIDNPKEILKQYIREFVIEYGGMSGENHGSIFALNLPLSNTKYVNDILVQDIEQIAVEIIEYHIDEYGHREDKDQYLTTINNLTNDELLSILSWMMETVEGGYWF